MSVLSRKELIAVSALIVGLFLIASLSFFSPKRHCTASPPKPALSLQVMTISPSLLPQIIRSQGTVAPHR